MQTNDIVQEMKQNCIEYAVAVNTDRSIPDARTGLKPVAKRILYGAYNSGYYSAKAHVKCARIVGDVMSLFHPHGDSSIYGALVRLAQPWVLRYPLIDFHGNMGNIGGDGPAAYRYTESRLSKLSEEGMLKGLKKNVVKFTNNYDDTTLEPETLPSIFPNLLCNPNKGIGWGMACNWLPHNLMEVGAAIIAYIKGEDYEIPGPDFPTGGLIINADECKEFVKNGRGSVKIRGKYEIDEKKNQIIFYEIPYGLTIEGLIEQIGKAAEAGEIPHITDVHDETNKKNIRLVITVEKKIEPTSILRYLFSKTDLQTSISYNQIGLIDKKPVEMKLKDCLKVYVDHNEDCLINVTNFELDEANNRLEIVNGIIKALDDIDSIIELIKESENGADARLRLQQLKGFTEKQAKAITAMRLSSLAKLEKREYIEERESLLHTIEAKKEILNSREKRMDILIANLTEIMNKFGDARRTELANIEDTTKEKEVVVVEPEDVVVIVNEKGLIKRIPKKNFKVQHRNGKGVKTGDTERTFSLSTSTIEHILLFSNSGKMYKLLVDKIPEGTNSGKGIPISTIVKMDFTEKIIAATTLDTDKKFIVFFTKNGLIKKSLLSEYTGVKKTTGIAAIKIKEGDSLTNIELMNEEDVVIITKKGMSIRFKTDNISPIGRVSMGVKGIGLKEGDEVLAGIPLREDTHYIATFNSDNNCKKIKVDDFTLQGRGGKGVTLVNSDDINVIAAAGVNDDISLCVIGIPNSIVIKVSEIPVASRYAVGVIAIKNSKINSVVKL